MNKPTDLQGLVLDPITGDQRYIGHSEPRHSARRLLQGQGTCSPHENWTDSYR